MEKVLILFSGGADSTAAAAYYLLKNYYAELVTFDNGAQRAMGNSEEKARAIIARFPDRCSWKIFNCIALFHKIAIKNLEQDVTKYGNLICCGCKLAMLAQAVIYCAATGIKTIADGFVKTQTYYPEQTPEYIEVTRKFAAEYGITYEHPLYRMRAEKIRELAVEAGIPPEPLQAECLFGLNKTKNSRIREYTTVKLPDVRSYITRKLKDTGTR